MAAAAAVAMPAAAAAATAARAASALLFKWAPSPTLFTPATAVVSAVVWAF
jgi:hypothetical protein